MSELSARIHPPFLHFPIAFWVSGTGLDLVQSATGLSVPGADGFWLAHLLLWSGVVAALPAIAAGLIDYARLPRAIQDGRSLKLHMLAMSTAFMLFLMAALWRVKAAGFADEPAGAMLLIELLGATALFAGGHAGGRVVFDELAAHGDGRLPAHQPSAAHPGGGAAPEPANVHEPVDRDAAPAGRQGRQGAGGTSSSDSDDRRFLAGN